MALISEWMEQCGKKVLDDAGIVRDAIFQHLSRSGSRKPLPRLPQKPNDSCHQNSVRDYSVPEESAAMPHVSITEAAFTVERERDSVCAKCVTVCDSHKVGGICESEQKKRNDGC